MLTSKGVVNSICSKNDFDAAKIELVNMNNIWELFVFPSINWDAKGKRVAQLINSMKLRAENVLFIDDESSNIEEVKYYLPDIQTLTPNNINSLREYAQGLPDEPVPNARLKHYKLLEAKSEAYNEASSNEEFLRQSNIRVCVIHDCKRYIDRIIELIGRTNQLNFTKYRMPQAEIMSMLDNKDFDNAVVSAKDNWGDYGIIGFYSVDVRDKKLVHFLFSCRTLGMGIEQYIYEMLNFPQLDVKGDVASVLTNDKHVDWITLEHDSNIHKHEAISSHKTILMNGPCDISALQPYFRHETKAMIETEVNYPDENGVIIAGQHLSEVIRQSHTLDRDIILKVADDSGFYNPENFTTKIFSGNYKAIIYSLLPDGQEGVYTHVESGVSIGFSGGNHSLCDPDNWENFRSGVYTNHNVIFTDDILKKFSANFEFRGFMAPTRTVENIVYMRENIPDDCILILLGGSEIECPKSNTNFTDLHVNHKAVNDSLCQLFRNDSSVKLINVTKYIHSPSDYMDNNIDHYSRRIYFEVAREITGILNEHKGLENVRSVHKLEAFLWMNIAKFIPRRLKNIIKENILRHKRS